MESRPYRTFRRIAERAAVALTLLAGAPAAWGQGGSLPDVDAPELSNRGIAACDAGRCVYVQAWWTRPASESFDEWDGWCTRWSLSEHNWQSEECREWSPLRGGELGTDGKNIPLPAGRERVTVMLEVRMFHRDRYTAWSSPGELVVDY